MSLAGKTAVVTGAGQGIGRAIARRLAGAGMQVCVADRDLAAVQAVADEIGGHAFYCEVADLAEIETLVANARRVLGRIDMFVSNAGYVKGALGTPLSADDEHWYQSWEVNVMAHVRACRAVLPEMIQRGEGWLVNVASAAGLLHQIGDAPYSATKHAAVSHAQSLAIEHGDQGIRVSVVCPLYVATGLLGYDSDAPQDLPNDRVLTAEDVADSLMIGLEQGRFLILPHEEAGLFFRRRAEDMDRWIEGMRRLRRAAFKEGAPDDLTTLHRRI